jgi:peptide/nickel transport system substrate-binding protein
MDWLLPYGWSWYTGIYPQELVKAGPKDWKNAVGTGPFMLKDYVSGATITYEKNPNYWGTAKIGGKEYKLPFVDRLVWPIIVDESTQLAALRTGKVDINEAVSYKYKATLAETNPELVRFRYLYTTFGAIAGRMDVKPFDDIRVRRALSMAIDRPAFINALQGGEAQILSGPYSAGWPESLYTPLEKLPQSARELFEYNPEKAKKLLTEAGYPTGFKTEMVISSTGTAMTDAASMLVDWWSKIGVTVALKPYDYAVYLSIQYGLTHKAMYYMSKGNGGPDVLWIIGRTPPYYWNPAMWNDKYVADTYEKARLTGDPVEAKKLLKELNVYMIDQCPYVILPVNYGYSYAWPWVKNWYGELNATVRAPGLIHAQIWIDRDLREKMIGKR